MGNQFRWKEEPGLGEQQQPSSNSERRPFRPEQRAQRVTALLLLLLLVAAWFLTQQAGEQAQRQRQENIQDMLEQARQSVLAGDGERFFSLFTANAAWRAAQLQPVNQLLFRAGARVQSLSHYPGVRQADVTWADGSITWQRTLFFAQTEDGWRIAPPEVGYWGQQQQRAMPWGTLVYYRLDEPWAEAIAKFASSLHAELCAAGCAAERLTLVVANGYGETAVPHTLHIPSPRLVALDETGQPGAPFWEMLHQRLEAYFLPVTIRFALPPTELPGVHLVYYDQAAAAFMAANPGITIELIKLESLPDDLGELAQYDGAAIKPTAAMISAGLVQDLTSLAITDPFFDSADYYERIWQGAIWQDRLWFLPQTAAIPLIFYDKNAFQQAQQLEPMLFWTWNELTALQEKVVATQPETSFISWGTIDANRDLLFSYAFHQQKGCTAVSPTSEETNCTGPLPPQFAAAALRWYSQMVENGRIPDFSQLTAAERAQAAINWLSARRRAVTWIAEPVYYEYHFLLDPIGVVPFPGSDSVEGVTPLHVDGNFISAYSERPLAVWQWLKFLSYQPPIGRYRYIPARPSVATSVNYWASLPRPLADPLRTAFSFSRPITIGDEAFFTWDQVTAVTTNQLTPEEAALHAPPPTWFSQP